MSVRIIIINMGNDEDNNWDDQKHFLCTMVAPDS